MEIIVLVENSSNEKHLKAEFGLSLLIHTGKTTILFDMGASALFAKNAKLLGEDLTGVGYAVVSHAHFDHGGGLGAFLKINKNAHVYIGKNADGRYYSNMGAAIPSFFQPFLYPVLKSSHLLYRSIGLDTSVLSAASDRVDSIRGNTEIMDNVYLISDINEQYPLTEGNKFLLEKRGDGLQYDRFDHELIMVIRDHDGLVLFTGCGHKGIRNMVSTVQDIFQGEQIKAVIGGFHLALRPGKPEISGSEEDIAAIGKEFVDIGVKKVITGHCTGDDACSILRKHLGESLECFSTGKRYII